MKENQAVDFSLHSAKNCLVIRDSGEVHFFYGAVGGFAVVENCHGERWPITSEIFYKEYQLAPTDFTDLLNAYVKSPDATLEGTEWLWTGHNQSC